MHVSGFGRADHSPYINLDGCLLETQVMLVDAEAVALGSRQNLSQLSDDLAQHSARLRFPRLTPEQPYQPLARLQHGLA